MERVVQFETKRKTSPGFETLAFYSDESREIRKEASTGVAWPIPIWDDGRFDGNIVHKQLTQNGEALIDILVYNVLRIFMGNTVGSKFYFNTDEDYYILGLWLADGYWRSSSVGLTSVNSVLIDKFTVFLKRIASSYPIKKRIYQVDGRYKGKQTAVQIYINSRSLTRLFMATKTGELQVPPEYLLAYLAGRIDGDGHVDTKYRTGIRIAYGSKEDALRDQRLFGEANMSLYHYKAARTFVLYLKKKYRVKILEELKEYCVKLAP